MFWVVKLGSERAPHTVGYVCRTQGRAEGYIASVSFGEFTHAWMYRTEVFPITRHLHLRDLSNGETYTVLDVNVGPPELVEVRSLVPSRRTA